MPDAPGKRPNGCNPTPTIATSMCCPLLLRARSRRRVASADGPEREGHDLVAVIVGAERQHHELHLHADAECLRISLREACLHLHLTVELDVSHAERDERAAG